jgi:hypothetical protein
MKSFWWRVVKKFFYMKEPLVESGKKVFLKNVTLCHSVHDEKRLYVLLYVNHETTHVAGCLE